jgi:head-tail adaptor
VSSPYGGPLVTDEMYGALREFAYQGLQTPVSILRREVIENPYGDSAEEWVDQGETWSWIRQMNDPSITERGGIAQTTGVFRVELPVGADVRVGDMIGAEGETYMVENTSTEDTVQVFLEVYARKTE